MKSHAIVGQVQVEFASAFVALIEKFRGDTRNKHDNLHFTMMARWHGEEGYYFNFFLSAPSTATEEEIYIQGSIYITAPPWSKKIVNAPCLPVLWYGRTIQ